MKSSPIPAPGTQASLLSATSRIFNEGPENNELPGRAMASSWHYRSVNLDRAGIKIFGRYAESASDTVVAHYVKDIVKTGIPLTGLQDESFERCARIFDRHENERSERAVFDFFSTNLFPAWRDKSELDSDGLIRVTDRPIASRFVPGNTSDTHRVTPPVPELLYGYKIDLENNASRKFTESEVTEYNIADLIPVLFPFLVVDTHKSLWAAENLVAGGTAACLGIIGKLNSYIDKCNKTIPDEKDKIDRVDNVVCALAIDFNMARMFAAWVDNRGSRVEYKIQAVEEFVLSRPAELKTLYERVSHMVDWALGPRRVAIDKALDAIEAEKSRLQKKANEAANR
ncbi:hypothetical protein SBRCBS47491_005931 [Sporothrix bragantina]|uniref:DUF7924 domain-containing protein n=1 Tax=Sporothrix bragantina TaxID=671064 RepID=A0ABP0C112_9PEZI